MNRDDESARWDFIRQMKGILAIKNQLSLAEFKLLVTLFEVNNEQGRRETFKIDNKGLAERAGMTVNNIGRVRLPLIEKGLVLYEPGKKGKPTTYSLKILYGEEIGYHDDTESEGIGYHDDTESEGIGYHDDTESEEIGYHDDTESEEIGYHDDTQKHHHDTQKHHHDTKKIPEALGDKGCETPKSIVKECKRNICANDLFLTFWKAYPKKRAKKAAEKAFFKLNPSEGLLEKMLEALERQKKSREWQEDGGQYIPYPATWINGERWEDVGVEAGECDTTPTREERRREYEAELQRQAAYMDSLEV